MRSSTENQAQSQQLAVSTEAAYLEERAERMEDLEVGACGWLFDLLVKSKLLGTKKSN